MELSNKFATITTDLCDGDGVDGALEADPPHLELDAAQLAQRDLHAGEPLAELLVELLLHVRRLHVLDDAGLEVER